MKKIIFLIMMAILILFSLAPVMAEERKISTFMLLENDWSLEGESSHQQTFYSYWSYRSFGAEFDVKTNTSSDYLSVKSSLTLKNGPLYAVAGVSTNSSGADYANTGFWYLNTPGKFIIFFDGRIYWAIDGVSQDYLDAFLAVKRSVGNAERVFVGLNLIADHWRDGKQNWYLAGPLVGYKVTDTTALFMRLSRSWDIINGDSETTDQLRIGLELYF